MQASLKISIITVVYNGEKFLEETIQSVINQSYHNIEYIIVDGGSTDGTVDIIKKYEDRIDYWVSKPDGGIYDAMNKGIDLATGDWINFMNAGDKFYNENVLKSIFSKSNYELTNIIYGNSQVIYPNRTRIAEAGDIQKIWKGSRFSHQSVFIKSEFHKINKYNVSNCIGADFEFFYKSFMNDIRFKYINIIVSSISSGGLSDLKRVDSIVSWWNVLDKNAKINFYYIWRILKEIIKERVKRIVR